MGDIFTLRSSTPSPIALPSSRDGSALLDPRAVPTGNEARQVGVNSRMPERTDKVHAAFLPGPLLNLGRGFDLLHTSTVIVGHHLEYAMEVVAPKQGAVWSNSNVDWEYTHSATSRIVLRNIVYE